MPRPRLLIEEWLPAQAICVECTRERSTGQQPPDKRLHVWWARRPLVVSRAAVLASLLPADFDRAVFERLLGFGRPGKEIVEIRALMDAGVQVQGGFGSGRAFSNPLREDDLALMLSTVDSRWGAGATVLDFMSGGGSIPLESARLGFHTLANELNPVACSVLEATIDYPFRFGARLAERARHWGKEWERRAAKRLAPFYPKETNALVHAYIFARTVPCPTTGFPTPLVPDWSLLKPKGGRQLVAVPQVINKRTGEWTITPTWVGKGAGEVRTPPTRTYGGGNGVSLFTNEVIPGDYIKAQAQQGNMGSALYAVALKKPRGLEFRAAEQADLNALASAEVELARFRPHWERDNIIPTEGVPPGSKTGNLTTLSKGTDLPLKRGQNAWADMFAPRQLLAMGVLVEELRRLRPEIVAAEGEDLGEAVVHMLAVALDKFVDYNNVLNTWESTRGILKHIFQRHDFSFKATYGEFATVVAGGGLEWCIDNACDASTAISRLPHASSSKPPTITHGSATNLLHIADKSITAVVVDPPYADNVQYAELADFFYVWLKRTQGHRHPDWFASYLTDKDEEAVVNVSRHLDPGETPKQAREQANVFYQKLMTDAFKEAHRILRDDGVLTVMFTHKKQEAWAALFESLIAAGFTITATWPVQTESQHSLHQANKNAAQSTVILSSRKREPKAGRAWIDDIKAEIHDRARTTAARLEAEGLNRVDQMVGAFGPAMEVYSRYEAVRTDTGESFSVAQAIQEAADAVAAWRVEELAKRGLEGVDPASRFTLLCWDVLGAAEFRFNEARLLGHAVGMDVDALKAAGLVSATGDKVKMLTAKERRRDQPVKSEVDLFGVTTAGRTRGRARVSRKVHPNDEAFASAIDMCHALALRHAEAGGAQAGLGSAKSLALTQKWGAESACARLMFALCMAAPQAVRFAGKGKKRTAADEFPEFRAWHALLKPLFGIEPPEWKEPQPPLQATLGMRGATVQDDELEDELDGEIEDEAEESGEDEA